MTSTDKTAETRPSPRFASEALVLPIDVDAACAIYYLLKAGDSPYSTTPLRYVRKLGQSPQSFSTTLSLALLALGFAVISSSDALTAFFVRTLAVLIFPQLQTGSEGGQMQGFSQSLNLFFTILSSREWNDMTQNLPPAFKSPIPSSSPRSSEPSSSFTAILKAWNVLVAGCISLGQSFLGIDLSTVLASSLVVAILAISLVFTISLTILLA